MGLLEGIFDDFYEIFFQSSSVGLLNCAEFPLIYSTFSATEILHLQKI